MSLLHFFAGASLQASLASQVLMFSGSWYDGTLEIQCAHLFVFNIILLITQFLQASVALWEEYTYLV